MRPARALRAWAIGRTCERGVRRLAHSMRFGPARPAGGLGNIPGVGVTGDQQNHEQDDPKVPDTACLSSLDRVRDRGAEKKYLQSGAKTRRNFNQCKLIDQGKKEDGGARQGGSQTQ